MQITFSDFSALSDQARQIMERGHGFFMQTAWFELLLTHVFVEQHPHTAGCLFAADKHQQSLIVCPARYVIEPMGLRSFYSLTCFYSPLFTFLSNEPNKLNLWVLAFFRALQENPLSWHRFVIHALPREDASALIDQLSCPGIRSVEYFAFANWYLPVNFPNYESYLRSRNSKLRNTVKRKCNNFNKLRSSRIELYLNEARLLQAEDDFAEVYGASWKKSEAYPLFIAELLKLAARQGALRLCIAYINEEPVAAQFWIVADQTAYIYKLAYKEAYQSLGIGTVLTATLLQYVIDVDQVKTVDYLTGDELYKRDWMTHRRERWGVVVFNTTTLYGCLLYWIEIFKRSLKSLVSKGAYRF